LEIGESFFFLHNFTPSVGRFLFFFPSLSFLSPFLFFLPLSSSSSPLLLLFFFPSSGGVPGLPARIGVLFV